MHLIAITNDDGIHSPGLKAVVEAVLSLGEVIVIAPTSQQTSSGRSIKGDKNESFHRLDYRVKGRKIAAYHCECSPARVVLHATDILFADRKPDLLISGINYGENLGSNITISGTIGAALQAVSSGIPSLAVSVHTKLEDHFNHPSKDWKVARYFTRYFAEMMLRKKMPPDVDVINVNIPPTATVKTPWKMTRLSRQPYFVNHLRNPSIKSRIGDAKVGHGFDVGTLEPNSDILVFVNGMVSVTPLSMDMTSRGLLSHKNFEL